MSDRDVVLKPGQLWHYRTNRVETLDMIVEIRDNQSVFTLEKWLEPDGSEKFELVRVPTEVFHRRIELQQYTLLSD